MPSQAPDLPTLLDFEAQFEDAAEAILEAAVIAAFTSQENTKLPLINTGISADLGPAIDELTDLALPSTWDPAKTPPQEYFRFTLALEFRIEVPRDENTPTPPPAQVTVLRTIRAKIRAVMLRIMFPFNDSNLPYYRVSDIRPNGATTGETGSSRNIDFCALRYLITFTIQPTAWPAYVP